VAQCKAGRQQAHKGKESYLVWPRTKAEGAGGAPCSPRHFDAREEIGASRVGAREDGSTIALAFRVESR